MSNYVKVIVGILGVAYLAQCKLQPVGEEQSVRSANDGLKIAANYIGDARCREHLQAAGREVAEINRIINAQANFTSHKLNGKNGELITKQFKQVRDKPNAQLSGDRFLARNSNSAFAIEDIEANCRRLVLSIDSHAPPQLKMKRGSVAQNQQQLFAQDFGEQGFGTLQCVDNLCTFSDIKGLGGNTRYFALIEPAREDAIEVAVGYYPHNSANLVNVDKIELEHIYFRDPQRYQDHPQVLPTLRPRDPHRNYVRDLHVRYIGGDGLNRLHDDTQVRVELQLRDAGGVVRKRYEAHAGIGIRGNNSSKHVATLNVKNICSNFIKADCGTQLEGFATRLSSMNAELAFIFERQHTRQTIFTQHQPVTPELLNNLLDRQGTLSVTGEGWTAKFAFDILNNKHLYLYFDWQRSYGIPPKYVYIDPATDCGHSSDSLAVKNKLYSLMLRSIGSAGQYVSLEIDTHKMLDHFKKQPCLQPLARGKSDQEFLQALAPTLVFHNRTHYNHDLNRKTSHPSPYSAWRYKLAEADTAAWFAARGGIIIVPVTSQSHNSEAAPVLEVGFQDRQ